MKCATCGHDRECHKLFDILDETVDCRVLTSTGKGINDFSKCPCRAFKVSERPKTKTTVGALQP